jgi:hypothetical protein
VTAEHITSKGFKDVETKNTEVLLAPMHLTCINTNFLSSAKVNIPELLKELKSFQFITGPIKGLRCIRYISLV